MRTQLYLKSSAELVAEIEARLADTGNALASDAQYLAAINEAIRLWDGRVAIPQFYELPDGLVTGTFEYTLPGYIRPPFRLQQRANTYSYLGTIITDNDNNYTWHDVTTYSVEPDSAQGWKLRVSSSPSTENARILYWASNPTLPTYAYSINDSEGITANATTVRIERTGTEFVPKRGYVRMDQEWMYYTDVTAGPSSDLTFTLVRGIGDTDAVTHIDSTVMYFGVATDDNRLWTQLYDQVTALIHALNMHKSTTEDIGRHEKLISYYTAKADNFWRQSGYVSQRVGRLLQSPRSLGPIAW